VAAMAFRHGIINSADYILKQRDRHRTVAMIVVLDKSGSMVARFRWIRRKRSCLHEVLQTG
jgi:Mg-chelatase subunit ChlD